MNLLIFILMGQLLFGGNALAVAIPAKLNSPAIAGSVIDVLPPSPVAVKTVSPSVPENPTAMTPFHYDPPNDGGWYMEAPMGDFLQITEAINNLTSAVPETKRAEVRAVSQQLVHLVSKSFHYSHNREYKFSSTPSLNKVHPTFDLCETNEYCSGLSPALVRVISASREMRNAIGFLTANSRMPRMERAEIREVSRKLVHLVLANLDMRTATLDLEEEGVRQYKRDTASKIPEEGLFGQISQCKDELRAARGASGSTSGKPTGKDEDLDMLRDVLVKCRAEVEQAKKNQQDFWLPIMTIPTAPRATEISENEQEEY